jgi:hypothetical protein
MLVQPADDIDRPLFLFSSYFVFDRIEWRCNLQKSRLMGYIWVETLVWPSIQSSRHGASIFLLVWYS